ncbi:MAG: hypothetical protein Athens101428_614 [Candidatus Berkelbacteria bacterium Athens1014_28]|uniref:Uncharacterized protein n=1 Tax=Candidatus Berkelbacteria bacterium Athens1014_28 TaxID=2017145 RepID=A0A554LL66_9BACT|nr:MAG: hypothetical protein Athens101428_614 [Candidatus Berkelbacteria bacterium Athens1014_28]
MTSQIFWGAIALIAVVVILRQKKREAIEIVRGISEEFPKHRFWIDPSFSTKYQVDFERILRKQAIAKCECDADIKIYYNFGQVKVVYGENPHLDYFYKPIPMFNGDPTGSWLAELAIRLARQAECQQELEPETTH